MHDLDTVPPAVAFYRVTTAMIDDYDTLLDTQLRAGGAALAMQPYYAGDPSHGLPTLAMLRGFAERLNRDEFSRGPDRQLMSLAYESRAEAETRYQRWREVLGGRNRSLLDEFDASLALLVGDGASGPPLFDAQGRTPLGDAVSLLASERH
mgnify:CR=1 FL=1